MLDFLNKYRRDFKFSQNGEEGIILECLERLYFHVNKGHAVEIGGNDGRYCSNTALLLEQRGWSGLFVEADHGLYQRSVANWANYPQVRHQCARADASNINAFVTDQCDLLSLDTDGDDYKLFTALAAKPKIVIVEIDSSFPPDKEGFNSDGGAGYFSMMVAALERGYFLLAHTGNLVLVRDEYKELFPGIEGHPILDSEKYFNRAWLKAA